jgi:hypothetical protein
MPDSNSRENEEDPARTREDREMRERSVSSTRVKVPPAAALAQAVAEAALANAAALAPTEPITPPEPAAVAVAPAEGAPPNPTEPQPAWPLFLGFASFGVLIGLVAGLSPVSGISEKLMASLFSFVGGVLLTYTGFQFSDRAGKQMISTVRVGGSLCAFSLALCVGIGLGATERIRDPLGIRRIDDGVSGNLAPAKPGSVPAKPPGSALPVGGSPVVTSAQPSLTTPPLIINSHDQDFQAAVRKKLRKGEYATYPVKNLIDELTTLSESCTPAGR